MTILPDRITGGVDTHLDVHVAAALDAIGGLLGVESFPADTVGYGQLLSWLGSFGTVVVVGVVSRRPRCNQSGRAPDRQSR